MSEGFAPGARVWIPIDLAGPASDGPLGRRMWRQGRVAAMYPRFAVVEYRRGEATVREAFDYRDLHRSNPEVDRPQAASGTASPRPDRRVVTDEVRRRIEELAAAGLGIRRIAREIGFDRSTVQRYMPKRQDTEEAQAS